MKFYQKRFFKRGLLALTGVGLIAFGASAFAHRMGSCRHGGDATECRAQIVAKVGAKLDLDANQKQQLDKLAQTLQAQRESMMGAKGESRQALQALVAGPKFDQAAAQALLDSKTAAVHEKGPALIAAMAGFYDSLRPEQQDKLRGFMNRHHGHA